MRFPAHGFATVLSVCFATTASATIRYVDVNSATPTPPYTSWATAATIIQDAVDAAVASDEIVVTNGLYATGGRAVGTNTLVNRVAVDKPLTLRSVNGPEFTLIQGYQVPGTTNGDGAIRCVYLTNGASLVGFTLTNGATRAIIDNSGFENSGGGVLCESESVTISNCNFVANSAAYFGGGVYRGKLNNCTFTGNSAGYGGGSHADVLNYCTLIRNSAKYGGGGASGFYSHLGGIRPTLNYCVLSDNSAPEGGGTFYSLLNSCTLARNAAISYGGGAVYSTLNSCALVSNSVAGKSHYGYGGGAEGSTLNQCVLTANWAKEGGGAYSGRLNNCTLIGNSATSIGGGAVGSALKNCILYNNTAPYFQNYALGSSGSIDYCCTTPQPTNGVGNITNAPVFVDQAGGDFHPQRLSPSINAGNNAYVSGSTDLDGYPRIIGGRVDIGAYESQSPLHYVAVNSTSPAAPYSTWATAAATIQDAVDAAIPSDEVVVTNGVYATGGRAVGTNTLINRVAVDKPLTLRSVNGPEFTVIQGYQVPGTTNGDGAIRCVYLAKGSSLSGFTLTNGATRISYHYSTALEANGGGVLCESTNEVISNCLLIANSAAGNGGGSYAGTMNDCTLAGNSARSAGGGAFGGILNQCTLTANTASMGGGASSSYPIQTQPPLTLNNCILIGNSASGSGGGAAWGTLNHCTLTGNTAASFGGGADACTLNYCTLSGNSTRTNGLYGFGGGAISSTLNQCLVFGNWSKFGGGTWSGKLNNCTVVGNSALGGGGSAGRVMLTNCVVYYNTGLNYLANSYPDAFASHSCTTPQPTNGVGNITNAPLFVNLALGDFRLQPTSPCINAGNNAAVFAQTDLDGNPRIVGGTVDIGAYEFQSPQSTISYAWLQQFGLPISGATDQSDSDADGHSAWQEWRAGTDPGDPLSALRILAPMGPGVLVRWQSVTNRTYFVERSTDFRAQPSFLILATNINGQPGTTSYADTSASGPGPFFYRVGVQP